MINKTVVNVKKWNPTGNNLKRQLEPALGVKVALHQYVDKFVACSDYLSFITDAFLS